MAEFTVNEVIDGDTFKVEGSWKWNQRSGDIVRAAGYNTPEIGDLGYEVAKEKLCHAFAGAFLLPKAILERELMKNREQITLWELEKIKQIYGISIQAIIKRAHMLGIVSDFFYRNFQVMLNRKGWKKKEPFEYKGREEAIRFNQLLHYGVSEEIITLSRGAELANMSLSEFMENVRAAV